MTKQPKSGNRFADLLGARDTPEPEESTAPAAVTGKRSNKDYIQISALVRKDTHKKVKATLIMDDQSGDFSDLVQQLLEEWLRQRE